MELSREHDIEARLYSVDGSERIYNLLGDSRLTRWLSQIIEKKLSDKQLWSGLIVFLESDLKVQQQKLLLQNMSDNMKQTPKGDNRFDKKDALSAYHTVESDSNKCYFCDGKDHVATIGPNGLKIIQYFVCKKFYEMTPDEVSEFTTKTLLHTVFIPWCISKQKKA